MTSDRPDTPITWNQLPTTVRNYLTAHRTKDVASAITVFAGNAGDFPGGAADSHFRFTLDGALLSRLVIEP
ncbi:hypothetical protein AB4Z42_03075 [Mycobacterium sp. 2YAF39]|uniref:hypothetical protein n=1 Tax=Mycobacterium sp. 2YAF39 TaxID=3233033 RepID=UPI003F945F7E